MRERPEVTGMVMMGIMVASCAHLDPAVKCAKDLCKTQPMVGYLKGAKLELDASYDQLKSAKVRLGAEHYEKLAQELNGYTAELELLNQSDQRACTDWALCQCRFGSSPGACDTVRAHVDEREDAARNFLERMKKLGVGLKISNVITVVNSPDSQVSQKNVNAGTYIENQTILHSSQEGLSPQQERLLRVLYDYQVHYGATKLIIARDGNLVFAEPGQKIINVDLSVQLLGEHSESRVREFEILMEEMPSSYLKFFPETRYDNPFVVAVTKMGVDHLAKK